MSRYRRVASLTALLLLAACATFPTGPSVMSLPGTGRSFDQFRADDADCRQFAAGQTGGPSPNESAVDSGLRTAAAGAAGWARWPGQRWAGNKARQWAPAPD